MHSTIELTAEETSVFAAVALLAPEPGLFEQESPLTFDAKGIATFDDEALLAVSGVPQVVVDSAMKKLMEAGLVKEGGGRYASHPAVSALLEDEQYQDLLYNDPPPLQVTFDGAEIALESTAFRQQERDRAANRPTGFSHDNP